MLTSNFSIYQSSFMKTFITLAFLLTSIYLDAQVLSDEYVLKVLNEPVSKGYCGTGYMKTNEKGESIYMPPTAPINYGLNELIAYGHGQIPQLMRLEKHLAANPKTLIYLLGKITRPQDTDVIEYLEKMAVIVPFEENEYAHVALSALDEIRQKVDL